MAEKDFMEKKLEDFDDVFADIINVLLFKGEHVVDEHDLESGMTRSSYKLEDKFEEQERDVKKFWKSGNIRLAVFGLENQTGEDPDFVFRAFAYDGAEYRDQVRRRNEIRKENARIKKENVEKKKSGNEAPQKVDAGKLIPGKKDLLTNPAESELKALPDFYPVITIVLYFGDRHWKHSLKLKDHLKAPERLEKYIPDYHVNLFEIAYLSYEDIKRFRSDFRFVAEYFVATRMRREGKEPALELTLDHLKHVEEFVELMNAVTNSDRFSKVPILIKERGGNSMYTILFDEAEARGKAIGKAIGEARGENRLGELMSRMRADGLINEAFRAAAEEPYRHKMYEEYGMLDPENQESECPVSETMAGDNS